MILLQLAEFESESCHPPAQRGVLSQFSKCEYNSVNGTTSPAALPSACPPSENRFLNPFKYTCHLMFLLLQSAIARPMISG